jgi:hypothetical protein
LSDEFAGSSSQPSTKFNSAPAVDYVGMIAALNIELAEKQTMFEQKVAKTEKVAEEKAKIEKKFEDSLQRIYERLGIPIDETQSNDHPDDSHLPSP